MPSKRQDITVRGGRAEKLEEIKESIEQELGYGVTWPHVLDELLEDYDGQHWEADRSTRR